MKQPILIFSQNFDTSTDEVMDWLWNAGASVVRLNSGDPLTEVSGSINDDELTLKFGSNELLLSNISAYWHRRGQLRIPHIKDWKSDEIRGDSIGESIADE